MWTGIKAKGRKRFFFEKKKQKTFFTGLLGGIWLALATGVAADASADPVSVLVPQASPIRDVGDLSGQVVCLMIGSAGQRALEAKFPAASPGPIRLGFREIIEMLDAYNVGRCAAMVAARSQLQAMQADGGINHLQSRLLPTVLDNAMPATAPISP